MKRRSVWEPKRVQNELARLARLGLSAAQIADRLNTKFGLSLSKNAVIGRIDRTEGLSLGTRQTRRSSIADIPLMLDEPSPAGKVNTGCRWLHGEPVARVFCGAPIVEGSSYCPHHFARCYRGLVNHPAQIGKAA